MTATGAPIPISSLCVFCGCQIPAGSVHWCWQGASQEERQALLVALRELTEAVGKLTAALEAR